MGSDSSSKNVIGHLKSIFSRHGIPECVISDNGPQYSAKEFSTFSNEWGFTHVTSSPHYARANGSAERAIQTIKKMLRKEEDPYLAMLAYRSSPQFGKFSPAELLMGRRIRTTVVTHPDNLKPELPDHSLFVSCNDRYKETMLHNHNDNPKVRPLQPPMAGSAVLIRDNQKEGVVLTTPNDVTRSAIIQCDNGNTLRRNRADVVPLAANTGNTTQAKVTRSGRVINSPKYLEAYQCD